MIALYAPIRKEALRRTNLFAVLETGKARSATDRSHRRSSASLRIDPDSDNHSWRTGSNHVILARRCKQQTTLRRRTSNERCYCSTVPHRLLAYTTAVAVCQCAAERYGCFRGRYSL